MTFKHRPASVRCEPREVLQAERKGKCKGLGEGGRLEEQPVEEGRGLETLRQVWAGATSDRPRRPLPGQSTAKAQGAPPLDRCGLGRPTPWGKQTPGWMVVLVPSAELRVCGATCTAPMAARVGLSRRKAAAFLYTCTCDMQTRISVKSP